MPFTFMAPIGSAVASTVGGKLKVPVLYIVLLSGVLQTLGFGLLASMPTSANIPARIYGFQVIAGFGYGIKISTFLLMVPFVVKSRDKGRISSSPVCNTLTFRSGRHGSNLAAACHGRRNRFSDRDIGIQ
jgi:hypothetical protein